MASFYTNELHRTGYKDRINYFLTSFLCFFSWNILETALCSFESKFHPLFNYTQANFYLDYCQTENTYTVITYTVWIHIHIHIQCGCYIYTCIYNIHMYIQCTHYFQYLNGRKVPYNACNFSFIEYWSHCVSSKSRCRHSRLVLSSIRHRYCQNTILIVSHFMYFVYIQFSVHVPQYSWL